MRDLVFLEGILAAVNCQDTQKRLKAAEELSNYLCDPSNGIEFIGFDKLLDGLVGWVNSSNLKVRHVQSRILPSGFGFVLALNRSRFRVNFACLLSGRHGAAVRSRIDACLLRICTGFTHDWRYDLSTSKFRLLILNSVVFSPLKKGAY